MHACTSMVGVVPPLSQLDHNLCKPLHWRVNFQSAPGRVRDSDPYRNLRKVTQILSTGWSCCLPHENMHVGACQDPSEWLVCWWRDSDSRSKEHLHRPKMVLGIDYSGATAPATPTMVKVLPGRMGGSLSLSVQVAGSRLGRHAAAARHCRWAQWSCSYGDASRARFCTACYSPDHDAPGMMLHIMMIS
jgi:hypothetical protein